ncbi:MAG: site-specific integrase [Candidatus Omnitrophica bacterium]|nr:site-specific integrase [Candidatus Omnitrophota bacterium]
MKTQQKPRRLPKGVRTDEWERLVSKIKDDKIALVSFLLAYGSGMRISEVCRCRKEHFRDKGIFIPSSKYGVERVVPIPKGWRSSLLPTLPIKVTIRTLQRKFKLYSKRAGLNPAYSFHSLRHGFATRLLENGTPINLVQLALGHADISTTGIYTKAAPTDLLKAYEENF